MSAAVTLLKILRYNCLPLEKNVEIAKQNVTIDSEYRSRKMNVMPGFVYVMTERPPTLTWKKNVMNATDIIMNIANLTNQDNQCNHTFRPINFIDSCAVIPQSKLQN
jgi:hypothetical protein